MDQRACRTAVRRVLAIILLVTLVECASGACLSYGHSCWGAHGKRSAKVPDSATDWYLSRLLKKILNADMENAKRPSRGVNRDLGAIFGVVSADDNQDTNRLDDGGDTSVVEYSGVKRNHEGIPMLDEEPLSKAKIWQFMRAAAATETGEK